LLAPQEGTTRGSQPPSHTIFTLVVIPSVQLWSSIWQLCQVELPSLDDELRADIGHAAVLAVSCLSEKAAHAALAIGGGSGLSSVHDMAVDVLTRAECNAFRYGCVLWWAGGQGPSACLWAALEHGVPSCVEMDTPSVCIGSYWDADHEQLGQGLFLEPAMFNHRCAGRPPSLEPSPKGCLKGLDSLMASSCLFKLPCWDGCSCAPNAGRRTEGRRLCVRAIQRVRAGEELCISYVPLTCGREERRGVLRKHFGFECACARCGGVDELPPQAHECGGVWMTEPQRGLRACSICRAEEQL
jgi:hypothetical protein